MAVETLLTKVAEPLLINIATKGLSKLLDLPPVEKALRKTVESFPQIEDLRSKLSTWVQSQEFQQLLERLRSGQRGLETEGSVVSSFIQVTHFFYGEEDETQEIASQVLSAFASNLVEALYASQEGIGLLANRQEQLHQETRTHTEQVVTNAFREALPSILKEHLPSMLPDRTADIHEKALHARIDAARDLLNQGRAQSAKMLLEQLENEMRCQDVSSGVRFRIATNLGACALDLEDTPAIQREFKRALEFEPDNPKALANAAIASLSADDYEEALKLAERARSIAGKDPHATSVYIETIEKIGKLEQIQQLLDQEPWILDDPSCLLVLAALSLHKEAFPDAERYARKYLEILKDDSAQVHVLLAHSLAIPIQAGFRQDLPLPWRMEEAKLQRLRDAEDELTKAIDLLKTHDHHTRLHNALVNRASIRALLDRRDEALQDCDRVLTVNPQDSAALKNKGLALVELQKWPEAVSCLEQAFQQGSDHGIAMALGYAYHQNGQPAKTLEILRPVWDVQSQDRRDLRIGHLILRASTALDQNTTTEEVFQTISDNWPDDAEALSILADQRRREGKVPEACDLLSRALVNASGNQRDFILLELADLNGAEGNYAKAAEYYAEVVDQTQDNPVVRNYLAALFYSGSYLEALNLSQRLRGSGQAIPFVSEIEARILATIGDYDQARELFAQLSELEPHIVSHRLHMAKLDLKREDKDSCRNVVANIPYQAIKDDAQSLMEVARLRAELGMPEVLPLAYRAKALGSYDPKIHLAYIGLFLRREHYDHELLEHKTAGINCTVEIQENGSRRTYTIVDEPIGKLRQEINSNSALASALFGKAVGETIVLREGLEDLRYKVVGIKSKYVWMFQETLSEFSTLFPDHSGLFRVQVQGNDFSKILTSLDERQAWVDQLMAFYRDRQLPLGTFAKLVGHSLIPVWAGMISREDGLVLSSTGTVGEQQEQAELLKQHNEIVMELTPLLLFHGLGLLSKLPQFFRKIHVPQAVLDDINEELRLMEGVETKFTVWKEDDRYFRHEITPEERTRDRNFLQEIRAFIRSSTYIVPVTGALELGKDRFDELKETLGESSAAAIIVAKQLEAVLFSDQLRLRQAAENDYHIKGVWSQPVLSALRESDLITADEHHQAIKRLALGHYHFVSLDSNTLFWILQENGMAPTPEVTRIFSLLHGPSCDEDSAVVMLANLLKKVWLETLLDDHKFWTLDLAVRALTTGRRRKQAIAKLKVALQDRFDLMPLQLENLLQQINLWQHTHRMVH